MRSSGQALWRQVSTSFQSAGGCSTTATYSSPSVGIGADALLGMLRAHTAAACRSIGTAGQRAGAAQGLVTAPHSSATSAAAADLSPAGCLRDAVRRLTGLRSPQQQSRGIFGTSSSKAPPPQQAHSTAPQQSVWVSDPAALKSAAGVGLVSGSAGIPHFSYAQHVVRPVVFSLAVSGGAYAWALVRDEDRRRYIRSFATRHGAGLELEGLKALQRQTELQREQWVDSLPQPFRALAAMWAATPEPKRTLSLIVAANLAVFAAWRLPGLQRLMARHFTHTPGAGRSHTLLTSNYSHRGLLHLACNMLALWGFGGAAMHELGRDQLLAYYVSAGVFASLASHLLTVWPVVGRNIPAAALLQRIQAIRPSLGASGAVIALFGLTAMRQPDAQVALIFAPAFPFSIGSGFQGMVAFDMAGVLLRWRIFDHAAHLGGASFGAWYAVLGEDWLWHNAALRRWVNAARQEWRRLGRDPAGEEGGSS